MPRYQVSIPGKGTFNVNSPSELTDDEVYTYAMQGETKPDTSRTALQAVTDPLASIGVGAGNLLQIPGQALKLAGATTLGGALQAPGEALSKYSESLQSQGLKARQALAQEAMSAAEKEGVISEFATAIKQTIKDPALLSTFLFEQLPQLLGPQAAASVATKLGAAGVKAAVGDVAKKAAQEAVQSRATKAALGTGAAMQGVDVGSDTYDAALKLLEQQRPNLSPEERHSIALAKARMAAVEGAGISLAAQKLPGGQAIERRMAGVPGAGRVKSLLGEAGSEMLEEGGGKFASNVGLNEIDPTQSLTRGIGTAAGLGAIGGGIMGGVLGGSRAPTAGAPGQVPINAARAAQQQAEAQATPASEYLSHDDLFEMAAKPNGYGELEQYKQSLLATPKTKQREAAVKEVKDLQRLMQVEEINRKREAEELRPNERGLPTPETSAFNDPTAIEPTVVEPEAPAPKVRKTRQKKGVTDDVSATSIAEGTSGAVEPPSAAPVVEGMGVDSQPDSIAPAIQSEQPGMEVPEPPIADGNGSQGSANPTVELDGKTFKLDAHNDSFISLKDDAGNTKRLSRKGKLGKQVEEQLSLEPVVEQAPVEEEQAATAAVTTFTPEFLASLGIKKKAGAYKKILGKEHTDPEARKTLQSYIENNNVSDSDSKDKVNTFLGGSTAPQAPKGGNVKSIIDRMAVYNNPNSLPKDVHRAADFIYTLATAPDTDTATQQTALKALRNGIDRNDLTNPAHRAKYDEVVKDVEDDGTDWGSYKNTGIGAAAPSDPEFDAAVRSGNAKKALQAVLRTAPENSILRLVAQRILKASYLPRVTVVDAGALGVDNKGRNVVGEYNAAKDAVLLSADTLTPHNLIHELIHGFFASKVSRYVNQGGGDAQIKRIDDLYQHLLSNNPELKSQYGMGNLQEFVAEAMSNSEFQDLLKQIPYKKTSYFREFAKAVLRVLGINDTVPAWNAAAEALISIETAMDSGRALQESRKNDFTLSNIATPQSAAVAQNNAIGERVEPTAIDWIKDTFRDNPTVKFRVKFADSLGGVENLFTKAYAGSIRDALGNLNPMVLMSRALDAARISLAAMETGTIVRDADGMVNAGELIAGPQFDLIAGERVSYQKVLEFISDQAKATGTTYKDLLRQVDETLYGNREYHLRERNNQIEADAQAFEAKGKQKEADALREQKSDLLLDKPPHVGQIDAAKRNYDTNTDIRKVAQMLDAIRFSMIDTMVETQRITAEEAQEWKDNKGYIPFDRLGNAAPVFNTGRGTNRGIAAMKNLKPFEGSTEKQSGSVVESFSGLMDWMTKESMKNEASVRALQDMALLGPAYAKKVPQGGAGQGKRVVVFENGVPTEYHVDDPLNVVAFSLSDPQLSGIMKAFQKAGQLLRVGVTAMPPFAFKQVADDIVRAYTYSGVKHPGELVARILMGLPKAWFNEAFRKHTAQSRALKNIGVVGTYGPHSGGNLKNILQEAGAEKRSVTENILHFLEAGAKASDMAVRQAVYEQVLKETGDSAKAESKAREVINFSRRGSSKMMGQLISVIPFFNAYARGMDKLATTITGTATGMEQNKGRALFAARMGVLFSMGLMYAFMMQDDDEYWAQPDYVRDANWILPWGKYLGFTPSIPVPQELAFIFKAIPDRIVQYIKYQGTDEERSAMSILGELAKRGIDVYSSPNAMSPQVLRPILEGMTNYSFFLKRPLESQSQLEMRPFRRYGAGTSDTAKAMAQGLEDFSNATGTDFAAISPIMIENMIRGVMGTGAGVMLGITDMLVNPDRTDRPLHQSLKAQLTGASAFMKDGVGTRFLDELYRLDKETTQVHKAYQDMVKTDPEKAAQFITDNQGKFMAYNMVHNMMEHVRTLNKMAMDQEKIKDIPPDERRAFMVEAKRTQNELAKQVFEIRHIIAQADKQQ